MSESLALEFGLVRKPDRRQMPDRRRNQRGGRRATDSCGFEVLSPYAEDEELAQVIATWGDLLRYSRPAADPRAAW